MSEYQELLQRLTKLEDEFNHYRQEKAMCFANVQTMSQAVSRLDHTVYGNGKEGLTTIIARTDERLASVVECMNGLPDVFQQKLDAAIEAARLKAEAEEPKEEAKQPSGADKAVKWFRDKILPYFVTGLLIVVLQAMWEMIKARANAP
jgi:hypothetical protein